jgi:hypothetical protein
LPSLTYVERREVVRECLTATMQDAKRRGDIKDFSIRDGDPDRGPDLEVVLRPADCYGYITLNLTTGGV